MQLQQNFSVATKNRDLLKTEVVKGPSLIVINEMPNH